MNDYYEFVNTPLPYAYSALEPYIDEKTMMLHHDKHLQTYIDKLNAALADYPCLQKLSLERLVCNTAGLPLSVRDTVKNNAGGVYNHRFYFEGMSPLQGAKPIGKLAAAINSTYGSADKFKSAFKAAAMLVFGSGYAWLTCDRCGTLKILTTANQDTPLTLNQCPILNIDVWEHAYYLKHYNKRADYIDDWFHVVDWERAEENYQKCIGAAR